MLYEMDLLWDVYAASRWYRKIRGYLHASYRENYLSEENSSVGMLHCPLDVSFEEKNVYHLKHKKQNTHHYLWLQILLSQYILKQIHELKKDKGGISVYE